jgi:type IV pilus assembly protein PilY1
VFGQRRGGKNYYALDITNTTNPQYLWTFNDTNLGETWSEPAIGKVKMSDDTDKAHTPTTVLAEIILVKHFS